LFDFNLVIQWWFIMCYFLKKIQFLFYWFLIFFLNLFVSVLLVLNFIIQLIFIMYFFPELALVFSICFSLCWDIFTFQLNPPVYLIFPLLILIFTLVVFITIFYCRSFCVINSFSYLVIQLLICWELDLVIFIFIVLLI